LHQCDINEVMFQQPKIVDRARRIDEFHFDALFGEQALEFADTLVRSGAMDVLVVDSVAALVPRAEIDGEMGDHHMALQARLMSQALRKLTSSLSRSNTLIIFINQIRSKVGCGGG
jgi:protein RecA